MAAADRYLVLYDSYTMTVHWIVPDLRTARVLLPQRSLDMPLHGTFPYYFLPSRYVLATVRQYNSDLLKRGFSPDGLVYVSEPDIDNQDNENKEAGYA